MKHYLKEAFNLDDRNIVSALDEFSLWSAPFGLKLLERIEMKPNMTVLDIGFGTGFPLIEIAMRLGESSTVYGIDPWKAGIDRAKKKITTTGVKNIKITEGCAESMPFKNNYFDMVVSNNGINNVRDIKKTFRECNRVMKKGGQFVFTMNLEKSFEEFYSLYRQVLREKGMINEIKNIHKHIYEKRKPLPEIKSLLLKHGFKIKRVELDEFKYRFTDGTAMLNHFIMKLAFVSSWKTLIPPHTQEEIFEILEERINKLSKKKGAFIMTVPFVLLDCYKK